MKKTFPFFILFLTNFMLAQIPCSSGISFNGTDDFISPDNTDAINDRNVSDRTFEFWFKTDDITSRQVIYEEGGATHSMSIFLEAGSIYFTAYRNSANTAARRRSFRSGTGDIEVDKWFHVAYTLDSATTLKWFLNGVEQDSQNGMQVLSHTGDINLGLSGDDIRFPSSLDPVDWDASAVGGSTSETYDGTYGSVDNTDYNYSGNISLFRIWNVARTQSEIDTNKSVFLTTGTDLVAYSDQDRIYYVPDGETEISLTAFVSLNTQYTTIPNTDAINLQNTNDRTIEFRFKATDLTSRQVLYEEGGNVNAFTAFIEGGQFYFGIYRDNAGVAADRKFFRSGTGDVVFNQWYHVAITLDSGTTVKWFLDGVEQDSRTGLTVDNHSGDINIGRSGGNIRFPNDLVSGWNAGTVGGEYYENGVTSDGAAYNFSGDFDLFRIWNVARTQSEIDTNKEVLITSETDLVAYQSGTQMNYQPNGGTSITATEDAAGIITWDGSSSDVWSLTTNWVGGIAPDATRKQKIAIPDGGTNDPVLTTEISVGFLTINSGVELIIESGATLNVYYGLDNNGTITVEDGGSIIYHNCNSAITGSGTFDVIRDTPTYSNSDFYSYWSSPIVESDASISTIFPDAQKVYVYDSASDPANWSFVGTGGNMAKGIGYAVENQGLGGEVRTFSGTINEAGTNLTLYFNPNEDEGDPGNEWSEEGDNLIGNPYASALDWDLIIEDTDNQDIEGTIYLWNQTSVAVGDNDVDDYKQYNPTGGASNTTTGYIGTAQGFFIRTEAATSIKIKPTHQVAANNTTFYKTSNRKIDKKKGRSWFKMSRENRYSTLLIGFVEKATNNFDRIYDGSFNPNQTSLGFYSLVSSDHDKKVSIQGLPLLAEDIKIVNLGFIVDKDVEHTISILEEHINSDYSIYLEDLEENRIVNLKEQDYTFKAKNFEENNTRFRVIYAKDKNETTPDDEIVSDDSFLVSVNQLKELVIKYDNLEQIEKVLIYNIIGSEVSSFYNNQIKDVSNLNTGVYIVNAVLKDERILSKKIVIVN